jgi:hypothetical protein
MNRRFGRGLVLLAVALSPSAILAFVLAGHRWPTPATTMYSAVPGRAGTWTPTFEDAANRWNADTVFRFSFVSGQAADPCRNPAGSLPRNGAKFSATECNIAFGTNVLAVTLSYFDAGVTTQAGIVFNNGKNWAIYDGPIRAGTAEFRRVAIHELGHVIGLDHENFAAAIMSPAIGDIYNPTADDIAGVAAIYGPVPDTVPDAFHFTDPAGVALGITVTSNPVAITGINLPAPISVTGGGYSIDCNGLFTAAASTIDNNHTVCVQHVSANTVNTNTSTTLTVGGVSDTFTSTTLAFVDTAPNPFTFSPALNVDLDATITSSVAFISGINAPAPVRVTGGSYSIGCVEPYTVADGLIQNGQALCLRQTSAATVSTQKTTTLVIGGVTGSFTTTTVAVADTTPFPFSFQDQSDVPASTPVTSNVVTIQGINAPAPMSVSGGTVSIGCSGTFTTGGSIRNNDTVCVRHTSGAATGVQVVTTLSIGGVSATFRSIVAAPAVGKLVYAIQGTLDAQENNCMGVIAILFSGYNCTWTAAPVLNGPNGWLGPTMNGSYYARTDTDKANLNYSPVAGDGKVALPFSGTLTLDANGTPLLRSDDLVSATLNIGPGARNVLSNATDRGVQTWDQIIQTLGPTFVSSAIPNTAGGVDYVLGARGVPGPLRRATDLAAGFTRDDAPELLNPAGGSAWTCDQTAGNHTPCGVGIERSTIMGNNVGGSTVGTIVNNVCASTSVANSDCLAGPVMWGSTLRPAGWDNLVLSISTDANGGIVSAEGWWTQEYQIGIGTVAQQADRNAMQGGHFRFTATNLNVVPVAANDVGTAFGLRPLTFNVLANDAGLADAPFRVQLVGQAFDGMAVVNADNTVTYTSNSNTGTADFFRYTVTDANGDVSNTGTVTVNRTRVLAPVAVADATSTPEGVPVTIVAMANDSLGDAPNALQISTPPSPDQGTASVDGSNRLVFTPNGFFSGEALFQYRITDGDGDVSAPALVTVTVGEKLPAAVADFARTTAGTPTAPINVLANDALGSGTAAQHVVAIIADAADGHCVLNGQSVVYTPRAGFSGDDRCRYQLTDADGDAAAADISIQVAPPLISGGTSGGGGGGSFDVLALLALAAGTLGRGRRVNKPRCRYSWLTQKLMPENDAVEGT